ncbi:MAG: type II toxin-antitoxin system VapC family toxin [Candidatus Limnocylindria bacterium]
MTVVVDASAIVAALIGGGADGAWAESELARDDLAAPHLMPAEVANILRRAALANRVTVDAASLAHADLLALPVALFPYEPLADRSWELRLNMSAYDAWYVALAESLDAAMVTLDRRIARAPGPRCAFRTPAPTSR